MSVKRRLCQTKQRFNKKSLFGFDIETYGENNDFLLASIVGKGYSKFFYSREEVIKEFQTNRIFRNSIVFATNLCFDFFGTFLTSSNFHTIMRGSSLLCAKTYFHDDKFTKKRKINSKTLKSLSFIDTLNYAALSVSDMGKIIGLSKLEKPSFFTKYPKNEEEWAIMHEYNLRDSQISLKFMEFFINTVERLGATFKMTIASTAMSLFKNKFLDAKYFQPKTEYLIDQLKSYYGGRTEAFVRGHFKVGEHYKQLNYYDFNSLYPSVMFDEEYPDVNTLKYTENSSLYHIHKYHGISEVEITIPKMKYPPLPLKIDGKVLFVFGTFRGYYTHVELRHALECGAKINKIYKTQYCFKTCRPFKKYVKTLYDLRNEFKSQNNKMEFVCKILLNSLYGKFGQKFLSQENYIHKSDLTYEDIENSPTLDQIGDYYKIITDGEPRSYCLPIWASYVSAYGRIKLHKAMLSSDTLYCDTDSLITPDTLSTSDKLGDLKLEMTINEGIIVRPKFYGFINDDNEKGYVKIKGLPKRLIYEEYKDLINNPRFEYNKILKFREAIRRGYSVNRNIPDHKEFNLDDTKRIWESRFDVNELQISEPIDIDTYISEKDKIKYEKWIKEQEKLKYEQLISSDNFDSYSVGNDITNEEFIDNEKSGVWEE